MRHPRLLAPLPVIFLLAAGLIVPHLHLDFDPHPLPVIALPHGNAGLHVGNALVAAQAGGVLGHLPGPAALFDNKILDEPHLLAVVIGDMVPLSARGTIFCRFKRIIAPFHHGPADRAPRFLAGGGVLNLVVGALVAETAVAGGTIPSGWTVAGCGAACGHGGSSSPGHKRLSHCDGLACQLLHPPHNQLLIRVTFGHV